jgi:hypothetical protein
VPLRFPRPVLALIAASTVAVSFGLALGPAEAASVRAHEWWLRSLDVNTAWATSQGAGVTVAVLSDGVDGSEPDLTGVVTTAPAVPGAPAVSNQFLGTDGTPVASLIAGRGHGSGGRSGIIGVAPQASILSVQVTLPANDPALNQSAVASAIPDAIAAGIKYAVNHGAKIIDLPLDPGQAGSAGTGGAAAAAGGSAAEKSAVAYAESHNVVLVAPAGDDGATTDAPNFPAAYPGVIAVGAFNSNFVKAPWSSQQSYVKLTAAGAGVKAAANNGQYVTLNSTSAASAVVAGIAALIRSRYPDLPATAVYKALITSTVFRRANGLADGSGYGVVNAERALAAAAAKATPASDTAGNDLKPLQSPAAIPAASASSDFTSQVVRAGEESGALLLVLLLLVALYGITGRRRRSAIQKALAPEWTHRQAQSRYPQVRTTDADRMLEVFAAPLSQPHTSVLGAGSARAALPAGFGGASQGVFAAASGRPDAALTDDDGALDAGRVLTHGPASRAVNRRPSVSGAPPWEPAVPPKSELPWTAGPGPESHVGWAQPGRQHDMPAASASPGIASVMEPADSGYDSLFRPADRPDSQEYDADPRQPWSDGEAGRPAAAAAHEDGFAWGGQQPAESWGGQQQPDESWTGQRPAEAWRGQQQPAEAWSAQQAPAQPWGGQEPVESWSAQQPAEPWTGQRPAARAWGGDQIAEPWRGNSQAGGLWAGSGSFGTEDESRPGTGAGPQWVDSQPGSQEARDVSAPPRPGQHRIAASGLPVRQPGATHQAAPSPSGSLWERAEPSSADDAGDGGTGWR